MMTVKQREYLVRDQVRDMLDSYMYDELILLLGKSWAGEFCREREKLTRNICDIAVQVTKSICAFLRCEEPKLLMHVLHPDELELYLTKDDPIVERLLFCVVSDLTRPREWPPRR